MNTRVGRWAPMLVVPAMVLALAGCSGDDDNTDGEAGDAETTATDAPTTSSETPTAPTTSPADLKPLPVVNKAEGAIDEIDYDAASCVTTPGEQTVSGTVTNPTDSPTGYLISISWTDATNNTLARGFTIVRGAKPGKETDWTLKADVGEGATVCVPFVQRGVIKK